MLEMLTYFVQNLMTSDATLALVSRL